MTRPLPSRLALAVVTLAVATLTACVSPTAPSSDTTETPPERGGGVYGGSSTMCGGGVYGGSSTC